MAQEVQNVLPRAVVRGRDGYLRVFYDQIDVKFETYDQWVRSGKHLPAGTKFSHPVKSGYNDRRTAEVVLSHELTSGE